MELLQRLRDPFKVTPQDAAEAADEIERLKGANRAFAEQVTNDYKEIKRLREVLRRIGEGDTCVSLMSHPPICKRAYDARSALQQKESK